MKVLYDIAPLGYVSENSMNKTGIPRVIEEVAYQLLEMPECQLEMCSNQFLAGALKYMAANPRLKNVPFVYDKYGFFLFRKHNDFQRDFDMSSGSSRLAARAKRKLLQSFVSLTKNSMASLDFDKLHSADIYHSTFTVLPEKAKTIKHLQIFLTVYDLIPALFPQYCDVGVSEGFQKMLSSINKDTWLLSISESTKKDLCNLVPLEPSHVIVTPLAADPALFYPSSDPQVQASVRAKYGIADAPYVLSLCTIEPRKNIDHVIRCYVRLMQEGKTPDLNLVLAGGKGWSYDHIFKEIAGAEALKDNIVVTGFVANEDLAALYSGALAFVFPSLYEGFGLPPLEAMQCGTPVITSNTSSLPEVVGDAGIMLDPKDADGLCQSVLSLYQDTDLREALSAKSLARAREFSWKRCAEDTVNAYKAALKS